MRHFAQADAKAIPVNALTGALVDEYNINATTCAESDAACASVPMPAA